jgi:hypothetical protein
VVTMLEKLEFRQLLEETRAMPWCQFVLGMVLALVCGFSPLHHVRFLAREPMLEGIFGLQ